MLLHTSSAPRHCALRRQTICRSSPRSSFQAQRLHLQEQLLDVLAAPDHENNAIRDLVLSAKESIRASSDFMAFQRSWSTAERQHNSPSIGRRQRGVRVSGASPQASAQVGNVTSSTWSWGAVRSLVVYGVGSLGAYGPQLVSGTKQRR